MIGEQEQKEAEAMKNNPFREKFLCYASSIKVKGALLIEYGVIFAFICIVGSFFLSDGSITGSITSIFGKAEKLLEGEATSDKKEEVKNLIAGNIVVSLGHNMNDSGIIYTSKPNDYAYQTTITSPDKDNRPFALDANSTYELIINPTIFGAAQDDYSFTLKLFRNDGTSYKNVFDSNGINVGKKDNNQWKTEAFDRKPMNVSNMSEYKFEVNRTYNDNNTITYTIKTGDTPLYVAGQVFANKETTNYQKLEGEAGKVLTDFGNAVVLTKKE